MKHYSFLNVVLLVQGVQIDGWPEGDDVIVAERLSDTSNHSIGCSGEMVMSLSNDRSGSITFKLRQNSESSELLTGLITAAENGAFVPVYCQIRNTEGGELVSGTAGFVVKPGNVQFGQNLQDNEWKLIFERLDIINVGTGNS